MPERDAPPAPLATLRGFPTARGPLDLDVHRGDVLLLAGPNGSGKTSLLRALAGLPTAVVPAQATLGGQASATLPAPELAARAGVALNDPKDTLVGLTVAGEFGLRGRPVPGGLVAWSDRDVATLSSGEARRVSLEAAGARRPPLLLLDEPTEGLDAAGRERLATLVADARSRGAVVVADHDPWVQALATRRVDLGSAGAGPLPPLPDAVPRVSLRATAATVRRGESTLALPSLALEAGVHLLAGGNGSGKSTLLLRLAGLLDSTGVAIGDAPPVPGGNVLLLLPRAGDLFRHATVAGELDGCRDLGLVSAALQPRHPLSLSAGESQRVALTKVLGRPAPLLLLDEPEAHLDTAARRLLWDLLAARAAHGDVVLLATHDTEMGRLAHTTVRLGAA
jgi:energy-coupling factor transport system ATP-binding protein